MPNDERRERTVIHRIVEDRCWCWWAGGSGDGQASKLSLSIKGEGSKMRNVGTKFYTGSSACCEWVQDNQVDHLLNRKKSCNTLGTVKRNKNQYAKECETGVEYTDAIYNIERGNMSGYCVSGCSTIVQYTRAGRRTSPPMKALA